MEKVKLPKRIAEPIGDMLAKGTQPFAIVRNHIENCHIKVNGWENLQNMNPDDLIRALYIGYEAEQTPEDKVRDYVLDVDKVDTNTYYAIQHVLKLLDIKIKGITQ